MSNETQSAVEECFGAARQFVEGHFSSYPLPARATLMAAYVNSAMGTGAAPAKKRVHKQAEAEPANDKPDEVTRFVETECTAAPAAQVRTRDIHKHYLQWAKRQNIARPMSMTMLCTKLRAMGYQRHKDAKYRYLIGLRCGKDLDTARV